MSTAVSQVNTVIDVIHLLTQALDQRDTSHLDELTRKVNDWVMDGSEKNTVIGLIEATEEMITAWEDVAPY